MKTKLVPFTFETFPKGIVWIKHIKSNRVYLVLSIETKFIATVEDEIYFDADLMYFEISTDLCRTWQPFGVVEEVEEPKRWRAEKGGLYFYISTYSDDGTITSDTDTVHEYDNSRWKNGNYFRTKEEAEKVLEKVLEKIKVIFQENIEK